MKCTLKVFLICLFGIPYATKSQTLAISEVLNVLHCQDNTCFKNKIVKKGFCFDKQDNSNYGTLFDKYSSCDFYYFQDSGLKTKNYLSFGITSSHCTCLTFVTSSKELSESFKTSLLENGFHMIDSAILTTTSIHYKYKNTNDSKIELEVMSNIRTQKGIGTWPVYTYYFKRERD